MGMAASQARFLGLTARKNNVEYEGQQINQQRTTLGNQSANYYNNLLGMAVPVPPSVQDYTKTVYTFQDGNLNNNITALIAQSNGMYKVSYVSSWQNDFTPVGNGAAVIFKDTTDPNLSLYKVGNQTLRELGTEGVSQIQGYQTEWVSQPSIYFSNAENYNGSNGVGIRSIKFINNGTVTNAADYKFSGTNEGTSQYINNLQLYDDNGTFKYKDDNDNLYDLNEIVLDINWDGYVQGTYRNNGLKLGQVNAWNGDVLVLFKFNSYSNDWEQVFSTGHSNFEINNVATQQEDLNSPIYETIPTGDAYLDSLTPEQKQKALEQEQEYKTLLNNKYNGGDQTQNWYVRYVQNTTSGVYEPIFYNENIVAAALYDENQTGASQSNIPCYKMGSAQETEEVKGVDARLEKDSTGRYINITLIPQEGVELTYSLTTSTITDQAAYEDAMNQYEFDKATYDNAIQEINSKIEIVQAEDKNLELRLKQLDTEQDAISTEMDAVQKVIEKNTESTFKTFG